MRSLIRSAGILFGSASLASAATTLINVDVNASGASNYTGAAAIGTAGDFWTAFNASTGGTGPVALNWSDNTASGITMAMGGGLNGVSNSGVATGNNMMSSYAWLFHNNGVANSTTITLSGFANNQTVGDIYLYAANNNAQFSQFTIGATTLSTTDSNGTVSPLTTGDDYVKFSNVSADGTGNIAITWTNTAGSGNKWAVLNGIQIQTVPEPSTALLGGLGVLALLRRRRC